MNPTLIPQAESELGLYNLPTHLDKESLSNAFETFQSQLLQLLGVPEIKEIPLANRLKMFERLAGLSLYLRTSTNLGSLARLAGHLSSIPIPRHVLRSVEHALSQLGEFRKLIDGRVEPRWHESLAAARNAYTASEKAFFDKSMVGQVYFPDEHKIAVYLPLLGPIGVPLVVGFLREIRKVITRMKR